MITSRTIYEKAVDLSFSTMYRGKQISLTIKPSADRFNVYCDGKLFGQIKIGYDRHSWYVVDSVYVEYELVKEIGKKIVSAFYK